MAAAAAIFAGVVKATGPASVAVGNTQSSPESGTASERRVPQAKLSSAKRVVGTSCTEAMPPCWVHPAEARHPTPLRAGTASRPGEGCQESYRVKKLVP